LARLFAILLLGLAPALAHATGFGGDAAPTRIPVPARLFDATVEDAKGTSVEVKRVSIDGEVYLHGKVGEGDVAVPFEKIAEVLIMPSGDPTKRIAHATLRDGNTVSVELDDDTPCWGEATFGNYKIEISKIRKITIRPSA
jgi:hypothetical protein